MHIGFFTPEFPTKNKASGGLASHLGRITKELKKQGHDIDVLVLDIAASQKTSFTENDIRVHYIPISVPRFIRTLLMYSRAFWKKIGSIPEGPLMYLLSGYTLSKTAREHEKKHPFDIIHTSNLETTALFLPNEMKKKTILRVSSKRDVWAREDGLWGPRAWVVSKIEEYMIRNTPKVYASSNFLKELYERAGGRLFLIRDPFELQEPDTVQIPFVLPSKYFLHIAGNLGHRKGTDVLFEALPHAFAECPDITVLVVGKPLSGKEKTPEEYTGDTRVCVLGPQPRAIVRTLYENALASVLPSTAETLPYTAIESLACKTPVIGTYNSSIDELVTPGKNGVLVPQGDPESLAKAMINTWKNGFIFSDTHEGILAEMAPKTIAQKLISIATDKN